jgi:hypothetical protein
MQSNQQALAAVAAALHAAELFEMTSLAALLLCALHRISSDSSCTAVITSRT